MPQVCKPLTAAVVMLSLALPVSSLAETSVTGNVQYEVVTDGVDTDNLYAGELNLSLSMGMDVNFNLGADAIGTPGSNSYALWPTLSFDQGVGGVFHVGMPRPAVDDYLANDFLGGSTLGRYAGGIVGSYLHQFAVEESVMAYGIRYDAKAGATSFGMSAHYVDEPTFSDELYVLTGGAASDVGAIRLKAGIEYLTDYVESLTLTNVGVEFGDDRLGGEAQVTYFVDDVDDETLWTANVHFALTEGLTFLGGLTGASEEPDYLFNVGMRYDFGAGLSATISYFGDTDNLDPFEFWSFMLGAEFGG